jgi:hypothetical protein
LTNPRTNPEGFRSWVEKLCSTGDDKQPLQWINSMVVEGPRQRITAAALLDQILSFDGDQYYGDCCAGHEDSDEASIVESDFEAETVVEEATHKTPDRLDESALTSVLPQESLETSITLVNGPQTLMNSSGKTASTALPNMSENGQQSDLGTQNPIETFSDLPRRPSRQYAYSFASSDNKPQTTYHRDIVRPENSINNDSSQEPSKALEEVQDDNETAVPEQAGEESVYIPLHTMPGKDDEELNTEGARFHREDFLRLFPPISSEQESMVAGPPSSKSIDRSLPAGFNRVAMSPQNEDGSQSPSPETSTSKADALLENYSSAWNQTRLRASPSSNFSDPMELPPSNSSQSQETSIPLKGILRAPTAKFPEYPLPTRKGAIPLENRFASENYIPPNAKWTKIDRRLVSPQSLFEKGERFEEREDCCIVLRVLTKEEIQVFADRTREIRGKQTQFAISC